MPAETIALSVIALSNLVTVVLIYIMRDTIKAVAANVRTIEKATNSLTDRLVATTKTEAHAAGVLEEKDRPK